MGAVVVPLAGVAVGPDGAAAASAARGRLQDLSEAPAHRTTSVVGQTPAQRMAKVHWRTPAYTPQPEATVGDDSGPCPVTCYLSEIKWRTVQPEPAQRVGSSVSSQERGRVEHLKVTKALTVGVTKDRMHTSPTSQLVRQAGWVPSKVLLPEEPEDLEEEVDTRWKATHGAKRRGWGRRRGGTSSRTTAARKSALRSGTRERCATWKC